MLGIKRLALMRWAISTALTVLVACGGNSSEPPDSGPPPGECELNSQCDDHNGCTLDSCSADHHCVFVADDQMVGKPCSDGMACTVGETCNAEGMCAGGAPKDCASTGDACNDGVCEPASGDCKLVPKADGTTCDDA